MRTLFKYTGRFQWWLYTVSHGQLLLRSTPFAARPTQVDVLFKDVIAVHLPTSIEDIEVLETEATDEIADPQPLGRKQFLIRGRDVDGYVVAGAVFHVEETGARGDHSSLMAKFPP